MQGGIELDKVIHDIVSIDLECAQKVEEAKKKKLDVQTNMSAKKKEIYESFVKEYQVKIDEHKQQLESQILETKNKNEQDYKESLQHLSNLYDKKKEEWISSIVNRCKEI